MCIYILYTIHCAQLEIICPSSRWDWERYLPGGDQDTYVCIDMYTDVSYIYIRMNIHTYSLK